MLVRINDNQGPAVVQTSQLEHWEKTTVGPLYWAKREAIEEK